MSSHQNADSVPAKDWNVKVGVILLVRATTQEEAEHAANAAVAKAIRPNDWSTDDDFTSSFESERLPISYLDINLATPAQNLGLLSDEELRDEVDRLGERFAAATPLQLRLTKEDLDAAEAEVARREQNDGSGD